MFDEFIEKTLELRSKDEPFAIATVVRFEAPVSGKPGDKAIIRSDGRIWGWIGGGCAQPLVIREALKALEDERARLVRIHPSPSPEHEEGVVDYTMTCHSGGSLDIFIEPVLSKPHVVLFGRSAVAQTLAKLAKAMNYGVSAIAPGAASDHFPTADRIFTEISLGGIKVTPRTYFVVATQGEHDEEALTAALRSDAAYIAFVASEKKAAKVFEALVESGIRADQVTRVKAPAGLEIGAISPEEIAASILAEIVQKGHTSSPAVERASKIAEEIDPVCGMMVDPARATQRSEYQGRTIFFCCAGCKRKFDQDPGTFLERSAPRS